MSATESGEYGQPKFVEGVKFYCVEYWRISSLIALWLQQMLGLCRMSRWKD